MDAERRLIASELMQRAVAGLAGDELLYAIKAEHPAATNHAIMRAAFFAVTRPDIEAEVIPVIHRLALRLRLDVTSDQVVPARI